MARDGLSAAIHGATGWLLRHWGQEEFTRQVDQTPVDYELGREWFVEQVNVERKSAGFLGLDSQMEKVLLYLVS